VQLSESESLAYALKRIYARLVRHGGRVGAARRFGIGLCEAFESAGLLSLIVIAANQHAQHQVIFREEFRQREEALAQRGILTPGSWRTRP
jgi:hypothetical protein